LVLGLLKEKAPNNTLAFEETGFGKRTILQIPTTSIIHGLIITDGKVIPGNNFAPLHPPVVRIQLAAKWHGEIRRA
jgi:hypothetical protein